MIKSCDEKVDYMLLTKKYQDINKDKDKERIKWQE